MDVLNVCVKQFKFLLYKLLYMRMQLDQVRTRPVQKDAASSGVVVNFRLGKRLSSSPPFRSPHLEVGPL